MHYRTRHKEKNKTRKKITDKYIPNTGKASIFKIDVFFWIKTLWFFQVSLSDLRTQEMFLIQSRKSKSHFAKVHITKLAIIILMSYAVKPFNLGVMLFSVLWMSIHMELIRRFFFLFFFFFFFFLEGGVGELFSRYHSQNEIWRF